MICDPCKSGNHDACPEKARQADPTLGALEKAVGAWCFCAHIVLEKLREHVTNREDC